MIDTADILLKAAEDVQSGMWCKGDYFINGATSPGMLFVGVDEELDRALKARRCAMGSVAVATALLGGTHDDYKLALRRVATSLDPNDGYEPIGVIAHYNDYKLPDDPFESGQQLAELFRTAAESL